MRHPSRKLKVLAEAPAVPFAHLGPRPRIDAGRVRDEVLTLATEWRRGACG